MRTRLLCVALLLLIAADWPAICSAATRDLVTMVDSRYASSRRTDYGAALVVAETETQTVLVTALHVVQDQTGAFADDIRIEFFTLRGATFPASVSRAYVDRALDLAVLFIDKRAARDLPRVLTDETRASLSPTLPRDLAGSLVTIVGAMGQRRWAVTPVPERVVAGDTSLLRIASAEARAGASGGAVVDGFGRLLAMASRVDSGNGDLVAVPMAKVLDRLKEWGIPIDLVAARAGTSSPELLEALRKDVRIEVAFVRPSSSSRDSPLGPSGPLPHRLTATLADGLRRIAPVIDVSYTTPGGERRRIELGPPTYAAIVHEYPHRSTGELWATFPDHRRLGAVPVSLDFESGPVAAAAEAGKPGQEALDYLRMVMNVERNNAKADGERSAAVRAQIDRAQAEYERELQPGQIRGLVESFRTTWRIGCQLRDATWTCRRAPGVQGQESLIKSMSVGTSPDDLPTDLPIRPAQDFQSRLEAEAIRLLSTDGVDALYLQMRLVDGQLLGPQRLCRVKRDPKRATTVCAGD